MTTSADVDQSAFVRALLDPELPPPNGVEASHGFAPERRFAIYRNNVCVGLVDALAERFPICLQLVGDEFFRAMAQCYVRERLPRTPMLFEYGDAFATFVSDFEPARALPYLPDVARLEYAVGQAYHAADAAPLPLELIRALPLDRLESATAVLHPSTHVVASAYPIVSIWRRHMSDDEMTPVELEHSEEALVTRPELAINVSTLPCGGSAFVDVLRNGRTFGEAMNAATAVAADFKLTDCLRELILTGAFVALSVAQ
ncbi:putative DNA-binding domain-containing protein [Methylocystis sp. L43]|uniref:HvfC/BufC N-terminal domain-containing protein n=1 Tax=unclassified Methylocystis TaxID=2625913 RepID=UPI0018C33DD2|nr:MULTISPECIES: DNA-binding domain-containing protein [unclassified Methylocystis]MBG0796568.1 putative DNA-binding domain-containing protein [Methylocystis sp. L43]MBG0804515.1 putative DNA-binding domain-containing protein [Methylocystis sp. H15]